MSLPLTTWAEVSAKLDKQAGKHNGYNSDRFRAEADRGYRPEERKFYGQRRLARLSGYGRNTIAGYLKIYQRDVLEKQ